MAKQSEDHVSITLPAPNTPCYTSCRYERVQLRDGFVDLLVEELGGFGTMHGAVSSSDKWKGNICSGQRVVCILEGNKINSCPGIRLWDVYLRYMQTRNKQMEFTEFPSVLTQLTINEIQTMMQCEDKTELVMSKERFKSMQVI